MQEEFYIGWQAEAPPSFARVVRRFVFGLCLLVPALAILLTYFQNGFSNGTFEFGKKTELEGIFYEKPFPFLAVENGKDAAGNPVFQKILLVGKGKFGFQKVEGGGWRAEGKPVVEALAGQRIKASGFLIYNDGKTALEVESIENQETETNERPAAQSLNHSITQSLITLRGEITDPKCLFGVMNPGLGKPHRDCAVRCIAGGIPPVLKVANSEGEAEYYLLADPNGEALNARILPFVGDGVQLCGRLEQDGDWLVLYADPATIQRVNKGALNAGVMCN
ncbi:MAG: hypothetical protein KF734_18090 [Saprospiraceae bacterium]|nr:hypothetical protein [Saprospiraceae bacterium]